MSRSVLCFDVSFVRSTREPSFVLLAGSKRDPWSRRTEAATGPWHRTHKSHDGTWIPGNMSFSKLRTCWKRGHVLSSREDLFDTFRFVWSSRSTSFPGVASMRRPVQSRAWFQRQADRQELQRCACGIRSGIPHKKSVQVQHPTPWQLAELVTPDTS